MPNIKSAKKRVLIAEKKTLQNKVVKTGLKTALKKVDAASESEKGAAIKLAIKKVDQAAGKNIMHKNTAARRKSALMKKMAVPAN